MKQLFYIKFYRIAVVGSIVAWAWIALQLSATPHNTNLTVCWLKRLTGLPCPGCGITRSIVSLLNGNVAGASQYNILGYPALLALVVLPIWIVVDIGRGRTSLYNAYTAFENHVRKRPILLAFLLLPIAINWGWDVWRGL